MFCAVGVYDVAVFYGHDCKSTDSDVIKLSFIIKENICTYQELCYLEFQFCLKQERTTVRIITGSYTFVTDFLKQ